MAADDGSITVTVNHEGLEARYSLRPNDYPVRIGRDPENDIVVENRGVSKFHAELRLPAGNKWPGYVCIADLSMNGTAIQLPGKDDITCVPRGTEVPVPDGAVFLMPWLLKGPVSNTERAQFTLHYETPVLSPTDEGEAQPELALPSHETSQALPRQVHHTSNSLADHRQQPTPAKPSAKQATRGPPPRTSVGRAAKGSAEPAVQQSAKTSEEAEHFRLVELLLKAQVPRGTTYEEACRMFGCAPEWEAVSEHTRKTLFNVLQFCKGQEPEEGTRGNAGNAGKQRRLPEAEATTGGRSLRNRTAPSKTTTAVKSDPGSPSALRKANPSRGTSSSAHMGAAPVSLGAASSTGLLAKSSKKSRPVHEQDPHVSTPMPQRPVQGQRDLANDEEQKSAAAGPKRRRVVPKGFRVNSTSEGVEEADKGPPATKVKLEITEATGASGSSGSSVPHGVSQMQAQMQHALPLPLPPPARMTRRAGLRGQTPTPAFPESRSVVREPEPRVPAVTAVVRPRETGEVSARPQLTSSTPILSAGELRGHEQMVRQPESSNAQGTFAYPVVLRPRTHNGPEPEVGQLCRTDAVTETSHAALTVGPEPLAPQQAAAQKVVLVPRSNLQVPPAPPAVPPIFTNVLSEEQAREFELMMREMI